MQNFEIIKLRKRTIKYDNGFNEVEKNSITIKKTYNFEKITPKPSNQ